MKPRHVPIRMCVVCRETSVKQTLLRVVRRPQKDGGGVFADPTGKANGRGAYVCASAACIDKAIKQKRFERSLGAAEISATLSGDLKAMCSSNVEEQASSSGARTMS